MISAKIIADSKNRYGHRITSFELVMPRIILAEFNTHRMFSRNSASSRAIKFEKMLEMVKTNPFIPIKWMKDHSGMQGNEFFESNVSINNFENHWLKYRDNSIENSKNLSYSGLTKQICNRLLEPFMWHKVIVTATEYENFFALRNNEAAEIHMQELARLMLLAYNESSPKELKDGEWHIPYGNDIDEEKLQSFIGYEMDGSEASDEEFEETCKFAKIKIATSRCAGVSYTIVGEDGNVEDYEKLIKRYDRLLASKHLSPFEHCAKTMNQMEYENSIRKFDCIVGFMDDFGWCGNFKGFIQLRKTIYGENSKDERVVKK